MQQDELNGLAVVLTFLRTAPSPDSLSCWTRISQMRQYQRRTGNPGVSTLTRSVSPFTTLSCIEHIVAEAAHPAYSVDAAAHVSGVCRGACKPRVPTGIAPCPQQTVHYARTLCLRPSGRRCSGTL